MRVKALISVINADTGKSVQVGEAFDLPDSRAKAAIEYGYVEKVDEPIIKVSKKSKKSEE